MSEVICTTARNPINSREGWPLVLGEGLFHVSSEHGEPAPGPAYPAPASYQQHNCEDDLEQELFEVPFTSPSAEHKPVQRTSSIDTLVHSAQKDAIAAMATLDRIIGRAAAVEPPGL